MASDKVPGYTPDAYPQQGSAQGVKLHTMNQLGKISQAIKGVNNYLNNLFSTANTWAALQTFTKTATFTGPGPQIVLGDSTNTGEINLSNTGGGYTQIWSSTGSPGWGSNQHLQLNSGSPQLYLGSDGFQDGSMYLANHGSGLGAQILNDGGWVSVIPGSGGAMKVNGAQVATLPIGPPQMTSPARTGVASWTAGDGAVPILTGPKGWIVIPFGVTISAVSVSGGGTSGTNGTWSIVAYGSGYTGQTAFSGPAVNGATATISISSFTSGVSLGLNFTAGTDSNNLCSINVTFVRS